MKLPKDIRLLYKLMLSDNYSNRRIVQTPNQVDIQVDYHPSNLPGQLAKHMYTGAIHRFQKSPLEYTNITTI